MRHLLAVVCALLILGGCGGGGDDSSSTTVAPTGSTSPQPDQGEADGGPSVSAPDDGPFCQAIRSLTGLSGTEGEGTPDEVLQQTEQMLDLLDEALVNVPEGAPASVEALFDDYRAIAEAIGAAGGDVDVAYATIEADDPVLAGRLADLDAHADGVAFISQRCGIVFR